jgi:hypothetical protein
MSLTKARATAGGTSNCFRALRGDTQYLGLRIWFLKLATFTKHSGPTVAVAHDCPAQSLLGRGIFDRSRPICLRRAPALADRTHAAPALPVLGPRRSSLLARCRVSETRRRVCSQCSFCSQVNTTSAAIRPTMWLNRYRLGPTLRLGGFPGSCVF